MGLKLFVIIGQINGHLLNAKTLAKQLFYLKKILLETRWRWRTLCFSRKPLREENRPSINEKAIFL
jgi:hypothetical protein